MKQIEFDTELQDKPFPKRKAKVFLALLDADAAAADAGNKTYSIEETREMVKRVVARRAGR